MATPELTSAAQRAILERVRSQLSRDGDGIDVIGIRSPVPPVWDGPCDIELSGRAVSIATCPSLLAVLDALANRAPDTVLVVLTDRPETELGDAVLARLHRGRLLDADRYTLLGDLLAARELDPRIRTEPWLVDALIELSSSDSLPATARSTLTLARAATLVLTARLGRDPEGIDLPALVELLDDAGPRSAWRSLSEAERSGLRAHLVTLHGQAAAVLTDLAANRDDVLADLLVAQAILAAPAADLTAATAFGRFAESRFPAAAPLKDDLATAAQAALDHVGAIPASARVEQQVRRADSMLDQLHASELAGCSPVLPSGYLRRLVAAATDLTESSLREVARHRERSTAAHRYDRLLAALRLRRWLATEPTPTMATAATGLTRHARELAWVDRALIQVRRGDPEPRVGLVLARVARDAGAVRTAFDMAFAARLAAAPETPARLLAVETLLPDLVAPLARHRRVLLIVVDGMSGAAACEMVDGMTGNRRGWTEVVRSDGGDREPVLAALPTETFFSRASLFAAALRTGTAAAEKPLFATHPFWPSGGAVLVHKAGLPGSDGAELGDELEQAIGPDGPPVVGVVLNSLDDALKDGRQSLDPGWRPEDVAWLPAVLDRAASNDRIVVLTSDHGHMVEHGSELRSDGTGGARWRSARPPVHADEVLVAGPRVLAPEGRAVFAATEDVRYGRSAYGYHGGVTLAGAAIPLVVLLPPGIDPPDGWIPRAPGGPAWWDGDTRQAAVVTVDKPLQARRSGRKKSSDRTEALFDMTPTTPVRAVGRGQQLIASRTFGSVHDALPSNRVPGQTVIAAVVDALTAAGGRLPLTSLTSVVDGGARNPRGLVAALGRVLNRDSFPVITLVDADSAVALDLALLDEQFPPDTG